MEKNPKSTTYHSKLGYVRRCDDSLENEFLAFLRLMIIAAKHVGTLDANKFLKFKRDSIWKSSNSNQSIKISAFNGLYSAEFLISANVPTRFDRYMLTFRCP